MQYLGGKARIGSKIATIMNEYIDGTLDFVEPFVGGFNIVPHIITSGCVECSDKNEALISLYRALQEGWEPPKTLTKGEYEEAKTYHNFNPLKAFAGFGVSFSGKWFGGYASRSDRDYALNCHNSLMKKLNSILCVWSFNDGDYFDLIDYNRDRCVIYCDPPYEGTTGYDGAKGFDHAKFWEWCDHMSKRHYVFVSEYACPIEHRVVFEKEQTTTVSRDKTKYAKATEKMFLCGGSANYDGVQGVEPEVDMKGGVKVLDGNARKCDNGDVTKEDDR